MADNGKPPHNDPDDQEKRIRDAFREDFLRSHEAAHLITDADEQTRIITEQAKRAGRRVDRNAVWNSLIAEAITADRAEGGDAAAEFDAAVERARAGVVARDIPVPESLDAARTALENDFPGTRFFVNPKEDTWGVWLLVTWENGPIEPRVAAVAEKFKGVQETVDGPVRWGFYGVSPFRRHTADARAWAEGQWNAAGVYRDESHPGQVTGIPDDAEEMTVAGRTVPASQGYPMERHVVDLLELVDLTTVPPA